MSYLICVYVIKIEIVRLPTGTVAQEQVPMFTKLVLVLTQSLLCILELQKRLLSLLAPLQRQLLVSLAVVTVASAPWLLRLLDRVLNTLPITSALLISTAQIAWQAMLIQADWFEPDAPELAPGVCVAQANGDLAGIVEGQEGDAWRAA